MSGDDCLGAGLRAVVRAGLDACEVICGDMWIGFKDGCATALRLVPQLDETKTTCVRNVLFNARFSCAPPDGWQRLYAGSCTVP